MTSALLGAVADDLTGACDLAAGVAGAGLATTVLLGAPAEWPNAEALVVALKSRTADPSVAVEASAAAAAWLLCHGTERLYQKYCSTFDSTDRGNIGPVADALASAAAGRDAGTRTALTVGTPATPAVGRTQYQGHLFVGDRLLSESSMREHPLTPMCDSDLVRMLGMQTSGAVALLGHETVRAGVDAIRAELRRHSESDTAHVLVDAVCDADLDALALALNDPGAFARPIVAAGAAGVGSALARAAATGREPRDRDSDSTSPVAARNRLIISGSASARTRQQVAAFPGATVTIDPIALADNGDIASVLAAVARAFENDPGTPVLVSATESPDEVRRVQSLLGTATAARFVEGALARVAAHAVQTLGVSHLIVAGGETSGAVAAALRLSALRVGRSAAAGVPWMVAEPVTGAVASDRIAVLFKSGNFGECDLFSTAWEYAP